MRANIAHSQFAVTHNKENHGSITGSWFFIFYI